MTVPLSLDPGRRDPKSPLYDGCTDCGQMGHGGGLCPRCEQEQEMERQRAEAQAEKMEKMQRWRKEAEAVAGGST